MVQSKQTPPAAAIGLYICSGMMTLLFVASIVGFALGGQDGSRPFFLMVMLVAAAMLVACLLSAGYFTERAKQQKNKAFASYAFEGEFAPQKKKIYVPAKKSDKKR